MVVPPLRLEEAQFVFHDAPAIALVTGAADFEPETTPYDVIMTLGDFPSYDFLRQERLGRIAPEVLRKLTAAVQIQRPYRAFIDAQPLFDGLFATFASQSGLHRLDLLGWLGNVRLGQHDPLLASPKIDGYSRFHELGLAERPYVTIHNGWDNVAHRHTTNATKSWPVSHYERFVAAFKQQFPQVLVVQLGAKTSRPIAGIDIGLLDDTTLHEAAWILKHSLLHVDGDSGLVHLARALHTKSIVLFGPTNHEFFSYEQNVTCASTVCGNCWWSTPDWMRSCPRGLPEPECMQSIEPDEVLDLAERHLRSLPCWHWQVEDWRHCEAATSDAVPAGSPSSETPFDEWRRRFVSDALRSADPAASNLRVALLDKSGWPSFPAAAADCEVRAFSFKSGHEPQDELDTKSTAAHPATLAENPASDYGSCYNLPAENGAFDVVVMPLLTDRVQYPRQAIQESLRVVRENGLLVMTYRLTDDGRGKGYGLHWCARKWGLFLRLLPRSFLRPRRFWRRRRARTLSCRRDRPSKTDQPTTFDREDLSCN